MFPIIAASRRRENASSESHVQEPVDLGIDQDRRRRYGIASRQECRAKTFMEARVIRHMNARPVSGRGD
jgi:hypothetical protein